jgi:hypothetical protein
MFMISPLFIALRRSCATAARARDAGVRIFAPRFPMSWERRASGPDAEL